MIKKSEQKHPEYIQELINQGCIYPDGERVTKSLFDVIDYLIEVIDPLTAQFVSETFRKREGRAGNTTWEN